MPTIERRTGRLVRATQLLVACIFSAQTAFSAEDFWINAGGGLFNVGSNWMDGSAPGPTDTANFNLPGSYIVQWNSSVGNTATDWLRVPAGDPTFLAMGGNFTHTVGSNVEIFGGRPVLGALSGASLHLDIENQINIRNDGSLQIGFGARATSDGTSVGPGSVSGSTARLEIRDGGRLDNRFVLVGQSDGVSGIVHIDGTGATMTVQQSVDVFNGIVRVVNGGILNAMGATIDLAAFDRTALLDVRSGGTVTVNSIRVGPGSDVQVNQGTLTTGDLFLNGGNFNIGLPASGVSTVNITNPNGVFRLPAGSNRSSLLELDNARNLHIAGTTIVEPGYRILVVSPSAFSSSRVVNNGKIESITNLVMGDPSRHGAYSGDGELVIFPGHSVTLQGAGFAQLGVLTQMNGGTLQALNGVSIPTGGELITNGSANHVQAKIATAPGSAIVVDAGTLNLGDTGSLVGVALGGELQVKSNSVTLLDANAAELGTLTRLGHAGMPGTLNAPNGAVVDFTDNIIGYGTVNTPNSPLNPTIINGHAHGNDIVIEPLTFTGYVKGIGRFEHVVFAGTHSPGLSISTLNVGSVAYSSSSTLIIELGGLSPAVGFDRINSDGTILLDGTLRVDLVAPASFTLGQSFPILSALGGITGEFDTLSLPSLSGGLALDVLYGTNEIHLQVISLLTGDYNRNGTVDAADYAVWRETMGQMGTGLAADGNSNGQVDSSDYDVWRAHFGQTAGSGYSSGQSVPIPEPVTLVLAAFLLVTMQTAGRQLR